MLSYTERLKLRGFIIIINSMNIIIDIIRIGIIGIIN